MADAVMMVLNKRNDEEQRDKNQFTRQIWVECNIFHLTAEVSCIAMCTVCRVKSAHGECYTLLNVLFAVLGALSVKWRVLEKGKQ